jgi:rhamnosyltransferase subunit B
MQWFTRVFTRTKPKRVLFAWELGGGLGHIGLLGAVARDLVAALPSVQPVFALRHPTHAEHLLAGIGRRPLLAAPVYRRPPSTPKPSGAAYDYADILHRCGYADSAALDGLVQAWQRLIADVAPSLIVCDHCPTLILAAGGGVPIVHVGTGFTCPPHDKPFLPLSDHAKPGATARGAEVLRNIQSVCRSLGRPELNATHELFRAALNLPCCLPELDPYRTTRASPSLSPFESLPPPSPIPANDALFGYLTAEFDPLPELLASFVQAKLRGKIYIRGATPLHREILAGSDLSFLDRPQPLQEALAAAAVIIHHGGITTTQTALAIGRPQFLFPRHLEQQLTARAVERLGCGLNLRTVENPGSTIAAAIAAASLRDPVATFARRLSERPDSARTRVLDAALRTLSSASG